MKYLGVKLDLTTPVLKDDDIVFPAENWFFYWKTSSALWKSKLSSFHWSHRIVVPLYWAYHTDSGDNIDFGSLRQETNLLKLCQVAEEVEKELILAVMIGPAPFLPNGGVPSFLAKDYSKNEMDFMQCFFDSSYQLNKMYSFFSPPVFRAFTNFVLKLGEYLKKERINVDVWGIESGFFEDGLFKSTFFDNSRVFEESFSRFVRAKTSQERSKIHSPEEEDAFRNEFREEIRGLYLKAAEDALSSHWEGLFRYNLLGADSRQFFGRIYQNEDPLAYTKSIFSAFQQNILSSSVLLSSTVKEGPFKIILDKLVQGIHLENYLKEDSYDDSLPSFVFQRFIDFIHFKTPGKEFFFHQNLYELGILPFFYTYYQGSLLFSEFTLEREEEEYDKRIHFISGQNLNDSFFSFMLKIFLNGGRVLLDKTGLDRKFQKKLQVFFLENELDIEQISFQTSLLNAQLGEGRLLIFDGSEVVRFSDQQKHAFWQRLIETFDFLHPKIIGGDDLNIIWLKRFPRSNELQYEEIRRVFICNQTSYKKKCSLKFSKNFVALKVLDEIHSTVQVAQGELSVELMPSGSLFIDFGVFS